jgi:PBP1b-binding outer membrane lipoprotein LpoB
MKKYIIILAGATLLVGCEQKETTVTNPPAEKKETTIIKESPAPESKTETKTETNINVNPSPSP